MLEQRFSISGYGLKDSSRKIGWKRVFNLQNFATQSQEILNIPTF
jgi:hypothetical protein